MEKRSPHYPLTKILEQMTTVEEMNLTFSAQDVYHAEWRGKPLYVKFQQAGEYFIVSFKEL
jgi:hypothetical protein